MYMYIYIYIHMCICICIYICIYVQMHMHMSMHMCMYVYMYICICISIQSDRISTYPIRPFVCPSVDLSNLIYSSQSHLMASHLYLQIWRFPKMGGTPIAGWFTS